MNGLSKALAGTLAARQIRGARENQEDEYGVSEVDAASQEDAGHTLLVLADGMGGHVGGSQASHIVIRTFLEAYQAAEGPISDRLRASLKFANDAVAEQIEKQPEFSGMGCTLIAVVISHKGVEWLSVGDSLLWKLDSAGKLSRLNADHSMSPVLEEMVESGRMTAEEAATDNRKHALRSAISGEEIHLVDLASQPVPLARGEKLLIASDGISTLTENEIARTISPQIGRSVEDQVDALLSLIEQEQKPGQDNTSIMLFEADRDLGRPALVDGNSDRLKPNVVAAKRRQKSPTLSSGSRPTMAGQKRLWLITMVLIVLASLTWFMVTRLSGLHQTPEVELLQETGGPIILDEPKASASEHQLTEPDLPEVQTSGRDGLDQTHLIDPEILEQDDAPPLQNPEFERLEILPDSEDVSEPVDQFNESTEVLSEVEAGTSPEDLDAEREADEANSIEQVSPDQPESVSPGQPPEDNPTAREVPQSGEEVPQSGSTMEKQPIKESDSPESQSI